MQRHIAFFSNQDQMQQQIARLFRHTTWLLQNFISPWMDAKSLIPWAAYWILLLGGNGRGGPIEVFFTFDFNQDWESLAVPLCLYRKNSMNRMVVVRHLLGDPSLSKHLKRKPSNANSDGLAKHVRIDLTRLCINGAEKIAWEKDGGDLIQGEVYSQELPFEELAVRIGSYIRSLGEDASAANKADLLKWCAATAQGEEARRLTTSGKKSSRVPRARATESKHYSDLSNR
jgi:hypothetical protein